MEQAITKPGIYPGISNNCYHGGIGISKSGLDLIHRSPAHFAAAKAEPRKETPAMLMGTVAHVAILEPDTFAARYAASPKFDRRTTRGKQDAAAFELETLTSGKTPIDPDMYDTALKMRDAVQAHPARRLFIPPGRAESSVFWHDAEVLAACGCEPDCMYCKARPDWLRDDGVIVDLKTTDSAQEDVWMRKVGTFRYHVQQAYYLDGVRAIRGEEPEAFVFLVVETSPPYGINICVLDQDSVDLGRAAYKADLQRYIECRQSGHWPSYSHDIKVISLPKWAA